MATPIASIYLHPGKSAVARNGEVITTILGSCVAVCLFDAQVAVGGMTHFQLPMSTANPGYLDAEEALSQLLTLLQRCGAERGRLRSIVAGGGHLLPGDRTATCLGERNLQAARAALKQRRIRIAAERAGNESGLKLQFHTGTGHYQIHEIQKWAK